MAMTLLIRPDAGNEAADNDLSFTVNGTTVALDEGVTAVATGAITLTGTTSAAVSMYSSSGTTVASGFEPCRRDFGHSCHEHQSYIYNDDRDCRRSKLSHRYH